MSKWQQVNLGEAIDILSGYAFKSKDFCDKGVPVLKIQNVTNSGVLLNEDTVFVSEDTAAALLKYKIHYDDILITMTGSNISQFNSVVGRVSKVKFAKPAMLNQRVGKILLKDKDSFCLDYIFYFLSQESTKIKLAQKASGSANQANISPAIIKSLKIPMPPIEVQRKIADILSAYDDLIENNRKQIRLLEEAAQRLYKEWFIDLRFPGHETTKIINGIPDGWERKCIGDICQTIGGGTPSTKIKEYYQGGTIKWVTPTDITRNNSIFLLDTEKKITSSGLSNSSAKLLPPFTILMTSRASVGYFALCEHEVCTNQGFISCIPHQPEARYFLLYNLMNRVDEIRQKAGGSTYLEINKNTFRSLSIIYPVEKICMEFTNILHPIMKRILSHKKTLELAIQSRNCLLPKLMTGELEVR